MSYRDKPWLKCYDPGVPATLDYPDQPVFAFLQESAARFPDNAAVLTTARLPLFGRQTAALTYRALDRQTDALAAGLVDLGMKKGDRVALVMPNCAAFVIAFYAILKAGGVVVAANPTFPAARMREQFNDAEVEHAITLSLFYPTVSQVQADTGLRTVIVSNIKEYLPPLARALFTLARERKEGHAVALRAGHHWLQDLLAAYDGQKPDVAVSPADPCIFQYTGGTTGVPKAAASAHRALIANTIQCRTWLADASPVPNDQLRFLAAIPLFHVYGLVTVLNFAISLGAGMVMVPNPRDTDEIVACLEHYGCHLFMGVPAMYNAVNSHPGVLAGKFDLSSITACISGSAPLPPVTKLRFEEITGGRLMEGYGMSEMPTATHCNPFRGENRTGSIGLPFPDVECRIVSLDDEVTDMPVGEIGELVLRGPQMMAGYYKMPTETANALRDGPDGQKWYYSGDIGYMDEDGYFYIVDRKKDMALIGGFNVYPNNVEKVLAELPQILDVAVAAVPHPDPAKVGQETLKAWVVLKPGEALTPEAIIAHARTKLAGYEVPKRFAFVDELPKTVVGKTLRRELVRMEIETRAAASNT